MDSSTSGSVWDLPSTSKFFKQEDDPHPASTSQGQEDPGPFLGWEFLNPNARSAPAPLPPILRNNRGAFFLSRILRGGPTPPEPLTEMEFPFSHVNAIMTATSCRLQITGSFKGLVPPNTCISGRFVGYFNGTVKGRVLGPLFPDGYNEDLDSHGVKFWEASTTGEQEARRASGHVEWDIEGAIVEGTMAGFFRKPLSKPKYLEASSGAVISTRDDCQWWYAFVNANIEGKLCGSFRGAASPRTATIVGGTSWRGLQLRYALDLYPLVLFECPCGHRSVGTIIHHTYHCYVAHGGSQTSDTPRVRHHCVGALYELAMASLYDVQKWWGTACPIDTEMDHKILQDLANYKLSHFIKVYFDGMPRSFLCSLIAFQQQPGAISIHGRTDTT